MIHIIYYAHSMEIYDTKREQEELERLQEYFPKALIYNPNRPYIQQSKNPMQTCLHVLKDMSITDLAFSHEGRKVPLGVYTEIRLAQKYHKPIWIINSSEIHEYAGKAVTTKKSMSTNWAKV
jgi:hypothetical protein